VPARPFYVHRRVQHVNPDEAAELETRINRAIARLGTATRIPWDTAADLTCDLQAVRFDLRRLVPRWRAKQQ
jgi:hypothetical protein